MRGIGAFARDDTGRVHTIGDAAAQVGNGCREPRKLHVFAVDDVLIRIVDVVLPDQPRARLVAQHHRQLLAVKLLEERQQIVHALCFSLQVMQTRVQGIAFSRGSAIGSPQSRHTP